MDRLLIWIFLLGFLQTALAQGSTPPNTKSTTSATSPTMATTVPMLSTSESPVLKSTGPTVGTTGQTTSNATSTRMSAGSAASALVPTVITADQTSAVNSSESTVNLTTAAPTATPTVEEYTFVTPTSAGVTSLGFLNMKLDSYVDLNNKTLSELITEFLRKILESAEFEVAVTYIENEVIGLATNTTESASATDQT